MFCAVMISIASPITKAKIIRIYSILALGAIGEYLCKFPTRLPKVQAKEVASVAEQREVYPGLSFTSLTTGSNL